MSISEACFLRFREADDGRMVVHEYWSSYYLSKAKWKEVVMTRSLMYNTIIYVRKPQLWSLIGCPKDCKLCTWVYRPGCQKLHLLGKPPFHTVFILRQRNVISQPGNERRKTDAFHNLVGNDLTLILNEDILPTLFLSAMSFLAKHIWT